MVQLRDINNNPITLLENAYDVGYSLSGKELWTARFSLPNGDPKLSLVNHHSYVEIEDLDGEYIGLFRIMPSQTIVDGNAKTTTFTCYHVFHTLTDSVYFGEMIKLDVPVSEIVEEMLSAQKVVNWVFGSSEVAEITSAYLSNSNGLVEPLYNLLENLDGDYVYTFNTRVYPWVLSVTRMPDEPVCRIKEGYNMKGFDISSDPSNTINRVYPICFDDEQNQVDISSVNDDTPYLEDAALVAAYGPIEYVYEAEDWYEPDALKAIGQSILDSAKEVKVTWNCSASDLIKLVGEPLLTIDRLRVNTVVRVETADFGDLNMVIRKASKRDMYGAPQNLDLELDAGNAIPTFDLAHVQKQLNRVDRRIFATAKSVIDKGREIATELINAGHGGHVRYYPNRILIMDTEEEATATNVWQYNLNGIGHSSTGVLGPYIYAWTIDGRFNTDFIEAHSITANQLSSDVGESLDFSSNTSITSLVANSVTELEDYVVGEVDARITNYSSEVDQRFDSITTTFTGVTTEIGDLNNELQTALDTISTYIRFSIDGIELGELGSPIKLFIENDRIVFKQNDVEVAYIDNNRLYITDGQFLGSLRLGEFAFIPRDNGNLSFGKVT